MLQIFTMQRTVHSSDAIRSQRLLVWQSDFIINEKLYAESCLNNIVRKRLFLLNKFAEHNSRQ